MDGTRQTRSSGFLVHHNRFPKPRNGQLVAGVLLLCLCLLLGTVTLDTRQIPLIVNLTLPFNPAVETAINQLQGILETIGAILLPVSLLLLALLKLAAYRSPRMSQIDLWSSREFTRSGMRQLSIPGLTWLFAGSIPVIASLGVALAIMTTSIGNEIVHGPNKPIQTALTRLTPGNSLVVQYSADMPMLQSNIPISLAKRVEAQAARKRIQVYQLGQNLSSLTVGGQTATALTLGVAVKKNSSLSWNPSLGCNNVPVIMSRSMGSYAGELGTDDGVGIRVVANRSGLSAMNRVGVVMDQSALAQCLDGSRLAPINAIVLKAPLSTAKHLLAMAKTPGQVATVITKAQHLSNSEKFWTSNVKPITNILAVISGLLALVAMAGTIASRLSRNRREYAAKLAAGVGVGTLRAVEVLRALKDGVVATIVGSLCSMIIIPALSLTESGFHPSWTSGDALVGASIGLLGCLGGAFFRTAHLDRAVDFRESTKI